MTMLEPFPDFIDLTDGLDDSQTPLYSNQNDQSKKPSAENSLHLIEPTDRRGYNIESDNTLYMHPTNLTTNAQSSTRRRARVSPLMRPALERRTGFMVDFWTKYGYSMIVEECLKTAAERRDSDSVYYGDLDSTLQWLEERYIDIHAEFKWSVEDPDPDGRDKASVDSERAREVILDRAPESHKAFSA